VPHADANSASTATNAIAVLNLMVPLSSLGVVHVESHSETHPIEG